MVFIASHGLTEADTSKPIEAGGMTVHYHDIGTGKPGPAAWRPSRAVSQGTPEELPSHILRHLSSPDARRAAPHYAWLLATRAGLSHRAGGAAHACGHGGADGGRY